MSGAEIVLVVIGAILVGFCISFPIVCGALFKMYFGGTTIEKARKRWNKPGEQDRHRATIIASKEALGKIPYQDVYTKSFDGLKLHGALYNVNSREKIDCSHAKTDNVHDKIAILVHGFHADPLNGFAQFAIELFARGYAVLIIDMRGHGQSEGKYVTYGIKEHKDVIEWARFAGDELGFEQIALYGTSMGGASVALASYQFNNPKVKVLGIDCAITSLRDIMKKNVDRFLPEIIYMPYFNFLCKTHLKVNLETERTVEALRKDNIPTIFLHGEADRVVPIAWTEENYEACSAPKKILRVPNAGHAISLVEGGKPTYDAVINFMEENL